MRLLLATLAILLLIPTFAFGQSTAVTLQVTDTDGQAWLNGTWQVQLISAGSTQGPFNLIPNGPVVPNQLQSGGLTALGAATFTLTPNASIAPSGTTWYFAVCPNATTDCYRQTVVISGASQTVTLTPPAIRISAANAPPNTRAYADTEIVTPTVGSQYFNTSTLAQRIWLGTIWTNLGGGSTSPSLSLTNSPSCTTANSFVELDTTHTDAAGNATAVTASLSSKKVIGVAVSGAGCSGTVNIATSLATSVLADNQTAVGDWVSASATNDGQADDYGATKSANVQTVGIVSKANSGPGTATTIIIGTGDQLSNGSDNSNGTVSNSASSPCVAYYSAPGNVVVPDCAFTTNGSGVVGLNSLTVNGAGAGLVTVKQGTGISNPSAGNATYYVDSGTLKFTCILPSGASCAPATTSLPFSGITSGANTTANMQASTGATVAPLNLGQVAGSQSWLIAGLIAPAATCVNSGGTINNAHSWTFQYTLNTAAGETLPSISVTTSTNALGCASNASQLSITAPTLGNYSSWNAYVCDTTAGPCTVPQKVAACTALGSGVNCVFTAAYGTNTTGVPTTNTAWPQPPNVQAFNGQPGEIPSVFFQKADGNYYPWISVEMFSCDATNGPPLPCGTPIFTHRTYFTDNTNNDLTYGLPVAFKNSAWAFNHRYAVGTTIANQDRAVGIFSENYPANDTTAYKGFFGIQQELDINGTPSFSPGPDNNVIGGQFQISNNSTGLVNTPAVVAMVNASYFNNTTAANGYLSGSGNNVTGVRSQMTNNNTNAAPGGTEWDMFAATWSVGTGVGTNLNASGYRCNFPTTATKFLSSQTCLYIPNASMTLGNIDSAADNEWQTSPGLAWGLAGPVLLDFISHDQVGAMNINASANVVGSITSSQISFTGPGMSGSCSGGASTYTYQLVFVDNNGGQAPAGSATANINGCTNPLTSSNPVTLNINANGLIRNDGNSTSHAFQQAVRIDVYRVSGPMATGKIGSLTCKFNINIYGCNAFLDTGLTATGTLPTVNTTGGVVAAGDMGFNQGKGQHFITQAANNDYAGTFSVSASTTGSVTFTRNYTATPVCVLTPQTTGLTSWYLSAISTSGFTVTVAPSGSYTFGYMCGGNPN